MCYTYIFHSQRYSCSMNITNYTTCNLNALSCLNQRLVWSSPRAKGLRRQHEKPSLVRGQNGTERNTRARSWALPGGGQDRQSLSTEITRRIPVTPRA